VNFDERRFRDALGAFPTGVAVVTGVTDAGERLGMTVSSFNSVSMSPPLVLFSVAWRAHSFAAWTSMQYYAINVLSQQQEAISNRFARPLNDKWSDVQVLDGQVGIPLLVNSLAMFECKAYARFAGGDHDIFVGQVIAVNINANKVEQPLVFFRGRYRRIDVGFGDRPPHDISIFEGW
jgi:flavin reductase (DIM6/NTAB) family NADH-FMN oxidoreductase RutF